MGKKYLVRLTAEERVLLLDGEQEARLIQIACREPPAGHARWTLLDVDYPNADQTPPNMAVGWTSPKSS